MYRDMLKKQFQHMYVYIAMAVVFIYMCAYSASDIMSEFPAWTPQGETVVRGAAAETVLDHLGAYHEIYTLMILSCCLFAAMEARAFWRGGQHRLVFSRVSITKYVCNKALAVMTAGGLVVAIPVTLYTVLLFLLQGDPQVYLARTQIMAYFGSSNALYHAGFTPAIRETVLPEWQTFMQSGISDYNEYMRRQWEILSLVPVREYIISGIRVAALSILGYFCTGMLWSLIAFTVSVWVPNRYAVLCIPVMLFHVQFYISPKSTLLTLLFYPRGLINGHTSTVMGWPLYMGYIIWLITCILWFLAAYVSVVRRVQNG